MASAGHSFSIRSLPNAYKDSAAIVSLRKNLADSNDGS